MIRALYTAASGMNAQQTNIDNVAHNLANVNTTGFKKSRVEFEDLVYQEIAGAGRAGVGNDGSAGRPRDRASARARSRRRATSRRGNLRSTGAPLDLAIEGDGFFQISLPTARPATRAPARSTSTRRACSSPPRATRSSRRSRFRRTRRRSASRRTASCRRRSPGQTAPQQLGTHRARDVLEPGRPAAARRQPLRRRRPRRARRRRARPAPTRAARSRRASSKTRTSASSKRWST